MSPPDVPSPPWGGAASEQAETGEVQELLNQHVEALERTSFHLEALNRWAGPGLDGRQLGKLMSGSLPLELSQGDADQRELLELQRTFNQATEQRLTEQQDLELRLAALTKRFQTDIDAGELQLSALQQLLPMVHQVRAAQDHLRLLTAQQEEHRGGKFGGLWRAVSGQAAARQREADQALRDRDGAVRVFQARALQLALQPDLQAEQVALLLEQEETHRTETQRQMDLQRRDLEQEIHHLRELTLSAESQLSQRRRQVETAWLDLSAVYGVPHDWHTWEALWEQRGAGQELWQQWRGAQEQLGNVTGQLTQCWSTWPPEQQNVSALRQWVRLSEAAALDRQRQAQETEVQRRQQERQHREALSLLLAGRHKQLEDVRWVAEREEAAQKELGARRTLPLLAAPQQATLPEASINLPGVRSGPQATAARVAAPQPDPQLDADQRLVANPLLRRHNMAAAQAAMCAEALQEWTGPGLDGVRLGQLVSQPLPPPLERALSGPARISRETQDALVARRETLLQEIELEAAQSAARLGPLRLLVSASQSVVQAADVLAQRTVLTGAAPASSRIGNGRHELRLIAAQEAYQTRALELGLTPAPRPGDVALLIRQEERRFQDQLRPLDENLQRVLQVLQDVPPEDQPDDAAGWAELSQTYGLPTQRSRWNSLWANRAKAQTLWTQWDRAQQEMRQQETAMAALWKDWPAASQNVTELRRALALAGRTAEQAEVKVTPVVRTAPPQVGWALSLSAAPPQAQGGPAQPAGQPPRQPVGLLSVPLEKRQPDPLPAAPFGGPSVATPPSSRPAPPLPGGFSAPARPVTPTLRPAPPPSFQPAAARPPASPVFTLTAPPPAVPAHPAPLAAPPSADHSSVFPPSPMPAMRPPTWPAPPPPAVLPASPLPAARMPLPGALPLPGQGLPSVQPVPGPGPLPEKLTRRQRAEREAARLGEQYDWKRGFVLLADALDRERWGRLRESIEREIAHGMTPEEFELVLQMRSYWHEQIHFQSPYNERYDSLPWGLGLALIRRCAGVPCLEEMTILIERFYDYAEYATSRRLLPGFAQRLGAILEDADPDVDLDYWLCARERG